MRKLTDYVNRANIPFGGARTKQPELIVTAPKQPPVLGMVDMDTLGGYRDKAIVNSMLINYQLVTIQTLLLPLWERIQEVEDSTEIGLGLRVDKREEEKGMKK